MSNSIRRALIFANGPQLDLEAARAMVRPDDYLIGADAGLRHIWQMGLQPHLVIGDLDSLSPAEIDRLAATEVRVERHPIHKDETDLELAILAAVQDGCRTILVLAALGGRLDMTLANIFLLGLPELSGIDVRLEDGVEEVFLIHPGAEGRVIEGQVDDRVSLLAWGGPAQGIRTERLYYPLKGETLYPERTRGISNRMVESRARVTLEDGLLICIHTRQSPQTTE